MQVSELIENDLPEDWQRQFGTNRFANLAGLLEFCWDAASEPPMWPEELFNLLDTKLPGGIAAIAEEYEKEGGLDLFPGKRLLQGAKPAKVRSYGHTSLTPANIEDLLDRKQAVTPGSAILLGFALSKLALTNPDMFPSGAKFEVRMSIYPLRGVPFADHRDLRKQGKASELANATGQLEPAFWDQVAAGLPMTKDTAVRVIDAIKAHWTPSQRKNFETVPTPFRFRGEIPEYRPTPTGSVHNKGDRLWYVAAERIILQDG